MERELINKTLEIFDTPEKWSAFLDLHTKKEKLKEAWCKKFNTALCQHFKRDKADGWEYINKNDGYTDCRWFLSEYKERSLCIVWEIAENGQLSLWHGLETHDSAIIKDKLFNDSTYGRLLSCFDYNVELSSDTYPIVEKGNWYFGSPYDGEFTGDLLAWYAGNRTQDLLEQLIIKVDRIRKDKELTDLMRELNRMSKR